MSKMYYNIIIMYKRFRKNWAVFFCILPRIKSLCCLMEDFIYLLFVLQLSIAVPHRSRSRRWQSILVSCLASAFFLFLFFLFWGRGGLQEMYSPILQKQLQYPSSPPPKKKTPDCPSCLFSLQSRIWLCTEGWTCRSSYKVADATPITHHAGCIPAKSHKMCVGCKETDTTALAHFAQQVLDLYTASSSKERATCQGPMT